MTAIKFCGITTNEALQAAGKYKAEYVGLMLWPKSSRAVTIPQARSLSLAAPSSVRMVGVFVNPSDDELKTALAEIPFDMIQLHGDEDPTRVAAIRSLSGLPVMKAIRLATREDLFPIPQFESVADWLLFDTKTSAGAGGTGQSFDWQILQNRNFRKPWMLSGGLTPENITRALTILKPDAVDVSSGIEDSPGIKNPEKMKLFVSAITTKESGDFL